MARLKLYRIAAPSAGLDQRHPGTMIADVATPDAENVRVEPGLLFKRYGYGTLTSASVASGVASGVTSGPMLTQNYGRLGGSVTAMLATVSSLYAWSGSAWNSIKSGLSGSFSGYHSATVMNDTWIYTNNVDAVQVYTGTGNASDLGGGTDYQTPDTHLCRAVLAFADRLLLLGTNEDGTSYPYRVRWSELGKTGEYAAAEGGGFTDLLEDPSGIQGGVLMGNYAAIYCGESIWLGAYVGGTVINVFDRVITETGCRAPRTIANLGNNEHVFMGNTDVYRFNGSAVLPIGEAVRNELFGGVSRDDFIRCFGYTVPKKHLYYLYVPYSSSGDITRRYAYDYEQGTWVIDTVDAMTCGAMLQLGAELTIDDFPDDQTIDQFPPDLTIDDFGGAAGERYDVFCNSAGYVYEDTGAYINDDGTAIDAYWCSKDLTLDDDYVHEYKRIEEIIFEARGDSLKIEYSTDMGSTWTTATSSQSLTDDYERYMVPIDVTTRAIRLRFTNETVGEQFWIRWFGLRFMVEGTR